VALKAGKRTASAEYLERFQREARNASHLQHPNIVAIFDSGCDGDEHYIACSLVHGRPLDRVLKAGMLPMREVVLIVRDIKRWDAETGQANLSITDRTNGVSCVACSADGKRIASGSADHTIKTWNAEVPAKKKP
jgi:serine/threonine protein kinase